MNGYIPRHCLSSAQPTPEHAAQAIGQADYSDGFIPRWIFQMPEKDKTWGQRAKFVDISWAQEEIGRLASLPPMEYSCSRFQLNTVQDWGEGKQQDVELDSNRDFKLAPVWPFTRSGTAVRCDPAIAVGT